MLMLFCHQTCKQLEENSMHNKEEISRLQGEMFKLQQLDGEAAARTHQGINPDEALKEKVSDNCMIVVVIQYTNPA